MSASCGLLCRISLPKRRFALEMIEHRPKIIDLLFQCGSLPRTEWYPESYTNSFAAEVLVSLMQFPLTTIPNLTIPLPATHLKEYKEELTISKEIQRLSISRSDWVHNLITLWVQYEDEDPEAVMKYFSKDFQLFTTPYLLYIFRWLDQVEDDWSTIDSPKSIEIFEIMRRRGKFLCLMYRNLL